MNYYPFHIGDYLSATRHLSWEEDAAYRRLLDTYYITEKPLPVELRAVCRLVLATTESQREAVEVVLQEFFELTEAGWINRRADAEIATMLDKQQKQREKANKRWQKPPQEPGNAPAVPQHESKDATASKSDADALPPTPTPTPTPVITPSVEGVSRKRSATPSTKPNRATVLPENFVPNETAEAIARETGVDLQREFASFCDHHTAKASTFSDWQAAFRTWLRNASKFHQPRQAQRSVPAQKSFAQNDREDGMRRWEEMTGQVHPDRQRQMPSNVIDITPRGETMFLES